MFLSETKMNYDAGRRHAPVFSMATTRSHRHDVMSHNVPLSARNLFMGNAAPVAMSRKTVIVDTIHTGMVPEEGHAPHVNSPEPPVRKCVAPAQRLPAMDAMGGRVSADMTVMKKQSQSINRLF